MKRTITYFQPNVKGQLPQIMSMSKETMTITFGDVAENHPGMQKLGKLAKHGLTLNDLQKAKAFFEGNGYNCELIDIRSALLTSEDKKEAPETYILVVRGFLKDTFGENEKVIADVLYEEETKLQWDKKAKMYGRVVDKHARWNLCYDETAQEPNYEIGKGRVVAWNQVPYLKHFRELLPMYFGEKANNLVAEGNRYYDVNSCYISYHRDRERKIVIALRLGASLPLKYQWFRDGKLVGKEIKLIINHGDLYAMSERAVGWGFRNDKLNLQHAAGLDKNIKIKEKKPK
jgi:hypothetical protein